MVTQIAHLYPLDLNLLCPFATPCFCVPDSSRVNIKHLRVVSVTVSLSHEPSLKGFTRGSLGLLGSLVGRAIEVAARVSCKSRPQKSHHG